MAQKSASTVACQAPKTATRKAAKRRISVKKIKVSNMKQSHVAIKSSKKPSKSANPLWTMIEKNLGRALKSVPSEIDK